MLQIVILCIAFVISFTLGYKQKVRRMEKTNMKKREYSTLRRQFINKQHDILFEKEKLEKELETLSVMTKKNEQLLFSARTKVDRLKEQLALLKNKNYALAKNLSTKVFIIDKNKTKGSDYINLVKQ